MPVQHHYISFLLLIKPRYPPRGNTDKCRIYEKAVDARGVSEDGSGRSRSGSRQAARPKKLLI